MLSRPHGKLAAENLARARSAETGESGDARSSAAPFPFRGVRLFLSSVKPAHLWAAAESMSH